MTPSCSFTKVRTELDAIKWSILQTFLPGNSVSGTLTLSALYQFCPSCHQRFLSKLSFLEIRKSTGQDAARWWGYYSTCHSWGHRLQFISEAKREVHVTDNQGYPNDHSTTSLKQDESSGETLNAAVLLGWLKLSPEPESQPMSFGRHVHNVSSCCEGYGCCDQWRWCDASAFIFSMSSSQCCCVH